MDALRTLIRDYRMAALLLVAMALAVKALVPQGYMIGSGQKLLSVQICLDGLEHKTVEIAIPMQDGGSGKPVKSDSAPCAFTALSMTALGGADAPLLALALLFILATGYRPITRTLRGKPLYLRPPLRGPPAIS